MDINVNNDQSGFLQRAYEIAATQCPKCMESSVFTDVVRREEDGLKIYECHMCGMEFSFYNGDDERPGLGWLGGAGMVISGVSILLIIAGIIFPPSWVCSCSGLALGLALMAVAVIRR